MAIKCMLCVLLLLTCFVLLLLIIFTNLSDGDESDSRSFAERIKNRENERLTFSANPMKILNLQTFQYLIDTKCNYSTEDYEDLEDEGRKIKAVWIITSYAGDVSKRSALRHAYTNEELRRLGVRRIFLLGTLDEKAQVKTGVTQPAIENEAQRFKDIIQGNFVEAYKNLTYKHLMGLQWAVDKCSGSYSYIMKMDDDIIVNLYEVLSLIHNRTSSNTKPDFLMGYVLDHMTPIRNQANKWFVTKEEFSENVYPSFLSGWFYVTDMLTALKLVYQSRQHSKYFWIDDLFVTGILREEAKIYNIENVKEYFTSDYRFLKCCLEDKKNYLKYKCDFLVGPDGGDPNLLSIFKKYSEDCYYSYNCVDRPKEQLLKDTCILDYKNFEHSELGIGNAQVENLLSSAMS
ncbi:beta-1,3-galactosyltransferase 5 [Nasonia vitripennis]|uniref:Hexosyltransferase n=1 Tax=Nasonia vitripennis TaxID=7425 RepID=A0A7M7H637_NASVI|nr:beta-1,3-galactosyltransferase 5 [Nasonia vitripennis]